MVREYIMLFMASPAREATTNRTGAAYNSRNCQLLTRPLHSDSPQVASTRSSWGAGGDGSLTRLRLAGRSFRIGAPSAHSGRATKPARSLPRPHLTLPTTHHPEVESAPTPPLAPRAASPSHAAPTRYAWRGGLCYRSTDAGAVIAATSRRAPPHRGHSVLATEEVEMPPTTRRPSWPATPCGLPLRIV